MDLVSMDAVDLELFFAKIDDQSKFKEEPLALRSRLPKRLNQLQRYELRCFDETVYTVV